MPSRWPCIFGSAYTKEQIDPTIQSVWKAKFGKGAPFGALRQMWRQEHCSRLNPYGSDTCPYAQRDCAEELRATAEEAIALSHTNPRGLFRSLARTRAIVRADNKPLPRNSVTMRTDVTPQGPSDPGAANPNPEEGRGLRRPAGGLTAVGDLLRALDPGARQKRTEDGKEGTER